VVEECLGRLLHRPEQPIHLFPGRSLPRCLLNVVELIVDRNRLEGRVNVIGHGEKIFGADEGTRVLAGRAPRPDLSPDPDLPDDTRLWAALQQAGGGTWGGRVYDVDAIAAALKRRERPSPRRSGCP